MDAAHSSVHVLCTTGDVSRMERDSTMPRDCNTSIRSPMLNSPVLIGGATCPPTCGSMGRQNIIGVHRSTCSVEVRNAQKFNTSIDGNLAKGGDSSPIFSTVIVQELSNKSSANIYLRCRMDFTINAVVTDNANPTLRIATVDALAVLSPSLSYI